MSPLSLQQPNNRRSLFIAICVFLLLDFAILGINLKITQEVESDAIAINIAGRQRMLSQKLTKSVLQLHYSQPGTDEFKQYRQEFIDVFQMFSATLDGLKHGGTIIDTRGQLVRFTVRDDSQLEKIFALAEQELSPLIPLAQRFIQGNQSAATVEALKTVLEARNNSLLTLMNSLTTRIEEMSRQKIERLRAAQLVTFLLALFNFAHIIWLFRRTSLASSQLINHLSDLLDNTSSCLLISDRHGRIRMANALARETFGYKIAEITALTHQDLFQPSEGGCIGVKADGKRFAVELHEKQFQLDDRVLRLTTVIDISHHRDKERQLAELANHDALTGLANRRVFYDRLVLEVAHADRNGNRLALFFIDLNGFKPVNDTHGHEVGDKLLITLAGRLKDGMRSTDTIARYGGDEFVIIAPAVNGTIDSTKIVEHLQKLIQQPVIIDDLGINVSASIGIALYPNPCSSSEELIAEADAAMYRAKQSGAPYCYVVHDSTENANEQVKT
ncbi:diguanylate cyclase [Pontibacterium granulatum]|uniref:diguanylate cyclase domain-containing protein n=1 Tax=Pontibacterium granulatum TaxID=2036029 RepID=UPI00249C07F2|nr:diguanylate cyclase [Pontibacterium granulatum]MDI3323269.1 diguanylate cyclase [Pontibacterium granulatum]